MRTPEELEDAVTTRLKMRLPVTWIELMQAMRSTELSQQEMILADGDISELLDRLRDLSARTEARRILSGPVSMVDLDDLL